MTPFRLNVYSLLILVIVSGGCANLHPGRGISEKPTLERTAEQSSISTFDYVKVWSTFMIDFYQSWISPVDDHSCPMRPTCSNFAQQAIQKYGFVKGFSLATDRLNRCNHDLEYYPLVNIDDNHGYEDKP